MAAACLRAAHGPGDAEDALRRVAGGTRFLRSPTAETKPTRTEIGANLMRTHGNRRQPNAVGQRGKRPTSCGRPARNGAGPTSSRAPASIPRPAQLPRCKGNFRARQGRKWTRVAHPALPRSSGVYVCKYDRMRVSFAISERYRVRLKKNSGTPACAAHRFYASWLDCNVCFLLLRSSWRPFA